ncbi:MAG: FMN-binding protein MioC [Alteromonas sp.]
MHTVHIIVGSVLGASEYVADAVAERLQAANLSTEIHLEPDFNAIPQQGIWLICTSTHGAGDLPDNIQPFADNLADKTLKDLPFWVLSLGDSSYDTFCYGGAQMHKLMQNAQAKALAEPLEVDVLQHPIPEEYAVEWLDNNIQLFTSA